MTDTATAQLAVRRPLSQSPLVIIILLFIVWRIATLAYGVWSTQVIPVSLPDFPADDPAQRYYNVVLTPDMPLARLVEPWHRFDTGWYLAIALDGYADPVFTAFAPLYPTLVGALEALSFGLLGGNFMLAGMIVSSVLALVALVGLYRLAELHFGASGPALRTVALIMTFPTAFYLLIPYAEGLYLALVAAVFLAAQRRAWMATGLLALLAALTRFHGVILVIPLGWMALQAVRTQSAADHLRTALRVAPAVLGAPIGTLAYLLFIRALGYGDLTQTTAAGWSTTFTLPTTAAGLYLERVFNGTALWFEHETVAVIVIMLALTSAAAWQALQGRLPFAYVLYAAATLGLSLSAAFDGAQYLSVFRHVLLLFPCFFVLAGMLKSRLVWSVWIGGMVIWQAVLILRFTHWVWVA